MCALRVAACVACVAISAAAGADSETRYALRYVQPDGIGCPSEAALRASVALELGYDPFADDAARVIDVAVQTAARGVRGRIAMHARDGRRLGARELTAGSCTELTPALELAIAMAIDPLRSVAEPAPPPSSPPLAPVPPPTPPVVQPTSVPVA